MSHNSVVLDTTHGFMDFPNLTMQVKSTASGTIAKHHVILVHGTLTISPKITWTITAFIDHPSNGIQQGP